MRQRDIDKLNRESERHWRSRYDYIEAKVGTVPMGIWITHVDAAMLMDGSLKGCRISFCEYENGSICTGIVTKIKPILSIDRL